MQTKAHVSLDSGICSIARMLQIEPSVYKIIADLSPNVAGKNQRYLRARALDFSSIFAFTS